jgi:Zn-dependent protease with chaperone function
MSAQFTRNPAALATALDKIESADGPTTSLRGSVAHLCITDPLGRSANAEHGFWADLVATHPPVGDRIAALNAMAYGGAPADAGPAAVAPG